jgi:hypothetical protein
VSPLQAQRENANEYLVSQGKSSSSAIENVFAQTDVLLDNIGKDGGPGALIDLRSSTGSNVL